MRDQFALMSVCLGCMNPLNINNDTKTQAIGLQPVRGEDGLHDSHTRSTDALNAWAVPPRVITLDALCIHIAESKRSRLWLICCTCLFHSSLGLGYIGSRPYIWTKSSASPTLIQKQSLFYGLFAHAARGRRMYARVCACMYVCIYACFVCLVCMYVCMCVCMYVMYLCMHVCMHVCVYVMYVCMYVCM